MIEGAAERNCWARARFALPRVQRHLDGVRSRLGGRLDDNSALSGRDHHSWQARTRLACSARTWRTSFSLSGVLTTRAVSTSLRRRLALRSADADSSSLCSTSNIVRRSMRPFRREFAQLRGQRGGIRACREGHETECPDRMTVDLDRHDHQRADLVSGRAWIRLSAGSAPDFRPDTWQAEARSADTTGVVRRHSRTDKGLALRVNVLARIPEGSGTRPQHRP